MASIRKRGHKQWEARIRRRGHPTLCHTFETKGDAEDWAKIIESEMVRHVHIDRSEAERVTLGQALERYRREVLPTKKGHQEGYVIDAWQREALSLRSLASIRPSDLAEYRDRRECEVSAKTVRLHLATISHLYTIATQEWGMGGLTNPVLQIRKPKLPQGRDRRLEGDEEIRLLAACKQAKSAWLAPLVEFAIETAMRRGELLSVTWRQVDIERRVLSLEETKNGERRDVPLSSKAVSILQALPRSIDGRVFPVSAALVNKAYRNAVARAGIEGLTFHDLRHEGTSRLFELHGNPFDGHTLSRAIADVERNTGVEVRRIHVDKGYRGHDYPNKFRVWISGQVRRTTVSIKREMKRRAAIEPIIGHLKAEHRMSRNYLKGRAGDKINAVLAAVGFNFHLLVRWLAAILRAWIQATLFANGYREIA